jgi:hypothetical protein
MNEDLGNALIQFGEQFETCRDAANASDSDDVKTLLYWAFIPTAPKTLGDLYESTLGAVFIDSQFSIEAVAGGK